MPPVPVECQRQRGRQGDVPTCGRIGGAARHVEIANPAADGREHATRYSCHCSLSPVCRTSSLLCSQRVPHLPAHRTIGHGIARKLAPYPADVKAKLLYSTK